MKSRNLLYILIVVLFGCTPQQKLQHLENRHPELFKPITSDSTKTTIQYMTKDSIIRLPGESFTVKVPYQVPCPEKVAPQPSKTQIWHQGTLTLKIVDSAGKETVTCKEDSLKEIIKEKDQIITTKDKQIREGLVQNNVYLVHWYDKFCRWWFLITFICSVLFILALIFKPRL